MMKKRPDSYFFIFLFAVSVLYGYPEILFRNPSAHHLWRQSDCLSITLNYCKDNRNFFTPAIHWAPSNDGKTISEFPIIYYTVAQLWKVFGQHEFIFRLINILIVLSGLYCLYRFAYDFLKDSFWALFIPFFLFGSPILAYYTNNFLADAPALGLSLIGGYFYWKSFFAGNKKWFYLSFLFFLLAGLIKVSSLLLFLSLFLVHLYIIFFRHAEKNWFNRYTCLWPYLAVMILIISWYRYTAWYNYHNIAGVFLQGLLPVWGVDAATRQRLWTVYINDMIPAYFTIAGFYTVLLLFIVSLFSYKYVNKFLYAVCILLFLGGISMLLLFYQALTVHDYYSINNLIFIPLPVIVFLDMLQRTYPGIFQSKVSKILAFAGLLFLLYTAAITTRMKYGPGDVLVGTNFIVNRPDVENAEKFNDWVDSRYGALREITPYLRHLGIRRDDRVFCIPDNSFNIPLYMMDQKGLTGYFCSDIPLGKGKLDLVWKCGCRYLMIIDTSLCQDTGLAPYVKHTFGTFKNVNIYKLDPANTN